MFISPEDGKIAGRKENKKAYRALSPPFRLTGYIYLIGSTYRFQVLHFFYPHFSPLLIEPDRDSAFQVSPFTFTIPVRPAG
jgi:hypothetical protein